MNKAREEATKLAVKLLSKFAGKTASVKETETMLGNLTDKQFDEFMVALRDGGDSLPYILPNLTKERLSVDRNLEIADELGHDFFEQIWITDPSTGVTHLTPDKYLVVDLPLRRLQQHLEKKIRIPKHNKAIDEMTGQPTSDSKGSKVSFPELQVLYSQGLESTIKELFKFRGGDEQAYKALNADALSTGIPSMDAVDSPEFRTKAAETLSILLKAAHLNNNL